LGWPWAGSGGLAPGWPALWLWAAPPWVVPSGCPPPGLPLAPPRACLVSGPLGLACHPPSGPALAWSPSGPLAPLPPPPGPGLGPGGGGLASLALSLALLPPPPWGLGLGALGCPPPPLGWPPPRGWPAPARWGPQKGPFRPLLGPLAGSWLAWARLGPLTLQGLPFWGPWPGRAPGALRAQNGALLGPFSACFRVFSLFSAGAAPPPKRALVSRRLGLFGRPGLGAPGAQKGLNLAPVLAWPSARQC